MKTRMVWAAGIVSWCLMVAGAAQETSAPLPERLRAAAVHWEAPAELSAPGRRELEATVAAAKRKQTDEALASWRALLERQGRAAQPFNPENYLDFVLNRVAVSRNASAEEACRRLRHYDAQENAVLEHVTTMEKQLSAYGEDHVTAAPLREPQLGAYEDGAEPVTLAPGDSVGAKEMQASLARWQERLPAISEAREAAVAAFVKAITNDPALSEELRNLEAALTAPVDKPAEGEH